MFTRTPAFLGIVLVLSTSLARAHHPEDGRFTTSRTSPIRLPLPDEKDAFAFCVYGDRTGGPAEGIHVLEQAVKETNVISPDFVMTVGDLVQGYNELPRWLEQAREFKGAMNALDCPWFPVAGNHDIYWRGKGEKPKGEHEGDYEMHFGPLWYAFEHKNSWFVALYSDEGNPATGEKNFDKPECQRMSAEQFAWLESVLERARDADNVFLFLHHPRWLERYGDDWKRVHARLVQAGNVRAVFAGHIHRMRYDGNQDGIEYFALATVGGDQNAFAPKAGYLHEFHIVTVRKQEIAVAALPVGSVMDARAVTGKVSEEVEALARALEPRWGPELSFADDFSIEGAFELTLRNPTARPIEIEVRPTSEDARWFFEPDHRHVVLKAGESTKVSARVSRVKNALDASFREPEVVVAVDYLAEGLRIPLPERRWKLPLAIGAVPQPARPEREQVLSLDGKRDALSVPSRALALPDGPFTVEGWLSAREYPERAGFANKTESSEFGLFVGGGVPEFTVHLDGRYVGAKGPSATLAKDRWTHLAGVFDGAEVRLYVDGVLVAAKKASGRRTLNDLPLILGGDVGRDGSANSFLPGAIDELRVSRGARYAGDSFVPARRFEADADTMLLLHMDGRVGPWHPDTSGRAVHASSVGEPRLVESR